MKKTFLNILLVFVLLLGISCVAFADGEKQFDTMVIDTAGLLDYSEMLSLDTRAKQITQQYQCAVYIVTLNTLNGVQPADFNETLFWEYNMGYGPEQSAILLLLSMEERDYDLMVNGYGSSIDIDEMVDRFLLYFERDDYYQGFQAYLDCCEEFLQELLGEVPERPSQNITSTPSPSPSLSQDVMPSPSKNNRSSFGLAVSIVIPLVVAFAVCSVFKNQMKTVRKQTRANNYMPAGGCQITNKSDQFLHTTRVKMRVAQNPPSGSNRNRHSSTSRSYSSRHRSGKF